MESIISSQMALRLEIEEKGYDNNITCADFTNETNRMVYGCSDGFIKVGNFFLSLQSQQLSSINLGARYKRRKLIRKFTSGCQKSKR